MTENGNQQADEKLYTINDLMALAQRMAALSLISDRTRAVTGGSSHDSNRDYYAVLGYKRNPDKNDFMWKYKFQDIAKRIVNLPPQDTWRKGFVLIDGSETSEDENPKSQFLSDWQTINDASREGFIDVNSYLKRVDRLAGIGQYGILLLGVRDGDIQNGSALNKTIRRKLSGPGDLLYLSPFSEVSVMLTDSDLVRDPADRRFGQPKTYQVDLGVGVGYRRVHWTRIIHVAEDLNENEVLGTPRLEAIMQRLDDLMKLVGGSSESAWLTMRKGVIFLAREGYTPPAKDTAAGRAMDDELFKFKHDLDRMLRLGGFEDVKEVGPDLITDPSKLFGTIISLISAATGIPQRILLGSERGELASSQDLQSWMSVIDDRRKNYAEPFVLRPLLNRFIAWGIMAMPLKGKYSVVWPNLFELSDLQRADLADKTASAVQKFVTATGATDIIEPSEFREKFLELPPADDEIEAEPEGDEARAEQDFFEEIEEMLEPGRKPHENLEDVGLLNPQ